MNAPTPITAGVNEMPGERLDQHAAADHLRDQVDEDDRQRAERGGDARRPLAQAEREHVGDRVLAGVAHPLGHEQQDGQERDERGDQADEAVDPEQEDQAAKPRNDDADM